MDTNPHKTPENTGRPPADPLGADLPKASDRESICAPRKRGEPRTLLFMPSAEAIADAIIRRATADLRG
jgi:hypothetical protein